jgi:hypothetical protein
VLSVFFGLLALNACVSHARRPTFAHYLSILTCTVLALLSKPMLVTLPVLMLLMDVWPLRRLDGGAGFPRATVRDLLFEKAPFFLLAGVAAAITLATVHQGSGLVALSETSLATRVAHATVSYAWYVWKTAWPARLAMFYPYPTWAAWQVVGAALVAAVALIVVVAAWRRARWITIGLAWWVVALFPVSGIFQAGSQGMADRFTYVPSIGLLIAVVWTLDALARTPRARAALGGCAVVATAALAIASTRQVGWWHDARTLYERTLAVTTHNWMIEGELGNRLLADGEPQRAYEHFARALAIEPRFAQAALAMGLAARDLGRPDEAVRGASHRRRAAPFERGRAQGTRCARDGPEPPRRLEAARRCRHRRLRRAARVLVARGRHRSRASRWRHIRRGPHGRAPRSARRRSSLVLRERVAHAVQSLRGRRRGRRARERDVGALDTRG